jgi:pyrroline-5-carboxylate reductase
MQISFIGAGKMASALAAGIAATDKSVQFSVYDINADSVSGFCSQLSNVKVCGSIADLFPGTDFLFLSVKPQNFIDIKESLASYNGTIISIMAGISISKIEHAAPNAGVIRVMPNTPCLVGMMAAGYSIGENISDDTAESARKLLETSGVAIKVQESQLDTVTALSGSGPAFAAIIIRHFIESSITLGLEENTARNLFFKTITGTVELLKQKNLSIEELLTLVTSKGGTTAAGRSVLENSDIGKVISDTLHAARKRSEELGK